MPEWIDCKLQFNANSNVFLQRFDRLCRIVEMLKEHKIIVPGGPIRLVPETPQSAMIHVYVHKTLESNPKLCASMPKNLATSRYLMLPEMLAEVAHQAVFKATSIRIWDKIRGEGHPQFVSETYKTVRLTSPVRVCP